jgi:hypothetical protein
MLRNRLTVENKQIDALDRTYADAVSACDTLLPVKLNAPVRSFHVKGFGGADGGAGAAMYAALLIPLDLVRDLFQEDVAAFKILDALPIILVGTFQFNDGVGFLTGKNLGFQDVENKPCSLRQAVDHRLIPGSFRKTQDHGFFHGEHSL